MKIRDTGNIEHRTYRMKIRDNGNIGHRTYRMKTIQRHWQHWAQKIQDEDNPETLATLGTEHTG